ncbi:MAG: hypothetical protein OXQ29_21350 [Rhodospirillaceae bacterium]|nr:hypothetical protein [Rhodospirillaceae bacterium]
MKDRRRSMSRLCVAPALLAATVVGACEDAPIVDTGDGFIDEGPPNAPPEASDLQLPDSLFVEVGWSVIILDVLALFVDNEPLEISATSSSIDVVTVDVWQRSDTTYADQATITAVGPGLAVVSLVATEPPFDPSDGRPPHRQPSGRTATRNIIVTVSQPAGS